MRNPNELISIVEHNGNRAVNARELHQFLVVGSETNEIGEQFSHWIKRMLDYGFEKGTDFEVMEYDWKGNQISRSGNQQVVRRDYALTIDCAKEISMLQKNEKGQQARKYFIAVEKRAKAAPMTALEIFENAARIERERLRLEAENRELRPKVALMDRILDNDTLVDIGQVAKLLKLPFGRNTLFTKLRERGIFFKHKNEPMQHHVANGHFVLKEKFIERSNHEPLLVIKVLCTQKGLLYLSKIFMAPRVPLNIAKFN